MSEQGPTIFNGRYELLRHIARGGMADVYLARDDLLDREVALKVLFPEFANDPNFVERFRREAQAAANLNHPNIVGIYDWGQERGTYYIVMEHVSGRSMADVLRSTGPLQADRAAEITADVAAALGTAHAAGLVHRDVKLGNILVSDDGAVKVADFGIATALAGGTEAGLTQHGSVMGTATYFSPEQAQGKPVDGRSDLYSLGVVLYEMLAGVPPFQAETPVAVAYKHVQEKPPSLTERGVAVAPSLEAMTMKLLAKNPANRYPTADDLRSDLRRYLAGAHKLPGGAAGAVAAGAAGAAAAGGVAAAAVDPGSTAAQPVTPEPTPPAPAPDATVATPATPGPGVAVTGAAADQTAAMATQYEPGFQYYDDEPPESGGGWGRSALLLVVLAALIGLLGFLLVAFWNSFSDGDGDSDSESGELIELQDYTGWDVQDARADLLNLGLVPDVELETNTSVPADEVFDQDPPAGQRVEEGSTITLTVSTGEAALVPGVVSRTAAEATQILEDAGYVVVRVDENDDAEAETVIAQDPATGSELAPGSPVTITVSLGPEQLPIPDVGNKSVVEATEILSENFRVADQVQESSNSVPVNSVIRTDPAAGTLAPVGSPVTIVVSTGTPRVAVPDVVGLFADSAIQGITNNGLTPVVELVSVQPGSPDVGRVVDQTPPANLEVEAGSVVTILVGEATEPPPSSSDPPPSSSDPPPSSSEAP